MSTSTGAVWSCNCEVSAPMFTSVWVVVSLTVTSADTAPTAPTWMLMCTGTPAAGKPLQLNVTEPQVAETPVTSCPNAGSANANAATAGTPRLQQDPPRGADAELPFGDGHGSRLSTSRDTAATCDVGSIPAHIRRHASLQ